MAFQPAPSVPAKLGKGQFKCFQCRQVFAGKDGDWYTWKSMEVHLCKGCEAKTREHPERTGKSR